MGLTFYLFFILGEYLRAGSNGNSIYYLSSLFMWIQVNVSFWRAKILVNTLGLFCWALGRFPLGSKDRKLRKLGSPGYGQQKKPKRDLFATFLWIQSILLQFPLHPCQVWSSEGTGKSLLWNKEHVASTSLSSVTNHNHQGFLHQAECMPKAPKSTPCGSN